MQADITISLGDERGLSCLTVTHDDIASRPSDGPLARVVVAGDLCWTPRPGVVDPSELDVSPWSDFVPLLAAQDMSIANLEAAITDRTQPIVKSGGRVRSAPSFAALVRGGGFGAVGLANNHAGDFGPQGVMDTLDNCREAGLLTVGAGADSAAAEAPLHVELNGVRIAFVAATEGNLGAAEPGRAGVAALRSGRAQTAVTRLSEDVGATVVLLHAGPENYPLPSPRLVDLARSFADAGAAAVIVHHQHLPGAIEVYSGVPIVYGTGNFLFPMYYPYAYPEWHEGYLVQLALSGARVCGLKLYPYFQSRGQRTVEPMSPADAGLLAKKVESRATALGDPALIEREWRRYCASQRSRYLSALLGLNKYERRLVKLLGVWPRWRMRRDRVAALLTVLTTESNREIAMTVLEEELRRSGTSSRGV
jgi:poly-gamma-glutamate synthesis protein (capsule biosynthesis protein)